MFNNNILIIRDVALVDDNHCEESGHITNLSDTKSLCRNSTQCGLTTCTRTFDHHSHRLQTKWLTFVEGILGNNLSCIWRRFTRTLELQVTGTGPCQNIAILVRYSDDGVVECRLDVYNPFRYILFTLRLVFFLAVAIGSLLNKYDSMITSSSQLRAFYLYGCEHLF